MSPIVSSIVTAPMGLITGLALGTIPVWFQQRHLRAAWRHAAEQSRDANRAYQLAFNDDTTGLPNRRAFLFQLEEALRAGDPTGVVLLDLDDFKTVNDRFGHERGNDLLAGVGLRLVDLPEPKILAARLSGDEFALLVCGDLGDVAAVARAAGHTIGEEPFLLDPGSSVEIRASVGYAIATPGADARQVLHHADMAMYGAKRRGDGIGVADPANARPLPPGRRYRDLRLKPESD